MVANRLQTYQVLYGQTVVVRAEALSDGVYSDHSQLTFDAGNLKLLKPMEQPLVGALKVAGFGEAAVYRGDIVQIEGKLYPTRGAKQGRMSFADLSVLGRSSSPIETLRRNFTAGMQSALPEPHASFGLGLLIGQRSTLPTETATILTAVGLTHIIAVSGYNLTIIINSVRRKLKKRSKYQTTIITLTLITLFLLLTGFSPSIVRAAVVSILSLATWYYGRTVRPTLLIVLAAALTAGYNPLYLWFDVGWWLSFVAFFGVLIVAPLLVKRLYGQREPHELTMIILESLSAQLLTAPLILYVFGRISLIGLVANVLVVPLVPLGMVLVLVAGLSGMLLPTMAGWLAWPARALLTYMLDMANLLSRVPQAVVQRSIQFWQMLMLYGVIGLVAVVLWHKAQLKHAKITEIKAVE